MNFALWTLSQGRGGGGVGEVCGQNVCYHVVTLRDSLQFDMQHDIDLKKFNFDLLTPRVRGEGGGVCGRNIFYHVAIFPDSNDKQHDHVLKKLNLTF